MIADNGWCELTLQTPNPPAEPVAPMTLAAAAGLLVAVLLAGFEVVGPPMTTVCPVTGAVVAPLLLLLLLELADVTDAFVVAAVVGEVLLTAAVGLEPLLPLPLPDAAVAALLVVGAGVAVTADCPVGALSTLDVDADDLVVAAVVGVVPLTGAVGLNPLPALAVVAGAGVDEELPLPLPLLGLGAAEGARLVVAAGVALPPMVTGAGAGLY